MKKSLFNQITINSINTVNAINSVNAVNVYAFTIINGTVNALNVNKA